MRRLLGFRKNNREGHFKREDRFWKVNLFFSESADTWDGLEK